MSPGGDSGEAMVSPSSSFLVHKHRAFQATRGELPRRFPAGARSWGEVAPTFGRAFPAHGRAFPTSGRDAPLRG
jgi:hypothetical protein